MSFLSLSNKPSVKAKVNHAKQPVEQVNMPPPEQENGAGRGAEVDMDDKDDEWYDTSETSSEDSSPVKSTNTPKMSHDADVENSIVSAKPTTELREEELLPYIPSLFSLDLPPCGLELQVAYELLVHRLRQHWLNHHGHLSTIHVVQRLQAELRNQNYLWPSSTLKGRNKRRKPWCRETVFKHQLQWIDYFQREAEYQDPELMTESEIWERRKESDVPPELKLQVERRDILGLWEEWNHKKRAKTKPLLSANVEEDPVMTVSPLSEDPTKTIDEETLQMEAKEKS